MRLVSDKKTKEHINRLFQDIENAEHKKNIEQLEKNFNELSVYFYSAKKEDKLSKRSINKYERLILVHEQRLNRIKKEYERKLYIKKIMMRYRTPMIFGGIALAGMLTVVGVNSLGNSQKIVDDSAIQHIEETEKSVSDTDYSEVADLLDYEIDADEVTNYLSTMDTVDNVDQTTANIGVVEDSESGCLNVHFLDVGQGDSTLIECNGHYALIDAGDSSKGTTVQFYLSRINITELDALILTHSDADHIGGADVIVTKYDIKDIYMSDTISDTKEYVELIDAIEYRNYKYISPEAGYSFELDNATITFLAPQRNYYSGNNNSYVIKVEYGEISFVIAGDAEYQSEKDMIDSDIDISADVLRVGHHGSNTSTSEAFLNKVNPTYAVISCGINNNYGHPHQETLDLLMNRGIQVFRTDEQGCIVAVTDGKDILWNEAPSETWQAGIMPDENNCVVETQVTDEKKEEYPSNDNSNNSNNQEISNSNGISPEASESTGNDNAIADVFIGTDTNIAGNTSNNTSQDSYDASNNSSSGDVVSDSVTQSNTTQTNEEVVWITENGKCYHSKSSCSNMRNPISVTREQAIAKGREACKKCY